MSIQDCLERLVAAKRISQKAADDALVLHTGVQSRLYPAMGPASADAAAALEVAKIMAQAAKERKLQAAKIAIRQAEVLSRMEKHGKGKVAGLMGALVRDNWEDGRVGETINVESHTEAVTKRLLKIMGGALEPYKSTLAGLRQDTETVWNVVDELFGVDTGDTSARAAAKGFSDAVAYAVDRVKREGKPLTVLEDWRLPQFWDTGRVRKFSEREFTDDLWREYEAGNLKVMDSEAPGEAPVAAVPGIIQNAYKDIKFGRGQGGGAGGFSNQLRVFRFNNADAYKRMMKKYGVGDGGLYNVLMGHIGAMAKDIAFTEVLGPQHAKTFERLMEVAGRDYEERFGIGGRIVSSITGNSPAAAKRTYDYLSGKLSIPESELMAGIFGGMRNLQTASRLGSAVVAALPGDSVTATLASNYNGIPASSVLARTVADLATGGAENEEIARQIGLTAATIMESALGTKRFADEIVGEGVTARLAESVIRLQGLSVWTETLKRSFAMEFMGFAARQADHAFDALDPAFRGFLQRYGFTAAEWEKLRATPVMEANGARFFDASAVADQRLGDRFMSAVIDERHFAVIEPDARIRQATSGGVARGTLIGEIVRSVSQFKSFPMTLMMTHMMRATTQGSMANRAYRTTQMLLLMTMGGAALTQVQSIIAGRDPQPMDSGRFWTQAFLRGGGGGMMADFVYSSTSRGGQGITEYLAGPALGSVIGAAGDAATTLADGRIWTGEKRMTGKMLSQHIKAWVPGSSLWFSKLATDRLIFDNIQAMIDPDYRKSFARFEKRMKKDYDQRFWWRPGQTLPDRPPDMSRMLPQ